MWIALGCMALGAIGLFLLRQKPRMQDCPECDQPTLQVTPTRLHCTACGFSETDPGMTDPPDPMQHQRGHIGTVDPLHAILGEADQRRRKPA